MAEDKKNVIIPLLIGAGAVAVGIVFILKKKFKVTITASPLTGYAPLTVNFHVTVEGGSQPYSYSWSFGDGSTSTLQNPTHTYQTQGNYTASLTVTDAKGNSATGSVRISVTSTTFHAEVSILSVE